MYCINCGAKLEEGDKFCANCGFEMPVIKECPECNSKKIKLCRKFRVRCNK